MNKPCHFVTGFNGERVLIPGCYGSLYANDLSQCHCAGGPRRPDATFGSKDQPSSEPTIEDRLDALETKLNEIVEMLNRL